MLCHERIKGQRKCKGEYELLNHASSFPASAANILLVRACHAKPKVDSIHHEVMARIRNATSVT